MIKIARIHKPTGEITGISTYHSQYVPNTPSENGDYIIVEVPEDTDSLTFSLTNYWKDGEWHTREHKPGMFYIWKNFAWEKDLEYVWGMTRHKRNQLISASDWTQFVDAPLTETQKEAWRIYRQQLRDIPETFSTVEDPSDVVWPTEPS